MRTVLLLSIFSILFSCANAKNQEEEEVPAPSIHQQIFEQPIISILQRQSNIIILSEGNNVSVSSQLGSDSLKFTNLTTYFEKDKEFSTYHDDTIPVIINRIQFNNDKSRVYALANELNYTLVSKNLGGSWKLLKLPAPIVDLSFNNHLRNNFFSNNNDENPEKISDNNNKDDTNMHAVFSTNVVNQNGEMLYYYIEDEQGFKTIEPLQYSKKCILLLHSTTICISNDGALIRRINFPTEKRVEENDDYELISDVSNIYQLEVRNGFVIAISSSKIFMSVDGIHWDSGELPNDLLNDIDFGLKILSSFSDDGILFLDLSTKLIFKTKYNLKRLEISITRSITYKSASTEGNFFSNKYGSDIIVDNKITNDNGDSWTVLPGKSSAFADFIPSAVLFTSVDRKELYLSLLNNETEFHSSDSFQKVTPSGISDLILSLFVNNGSAMIIIDNRANLFYSFDFGATWKFESMLSNSNGNNNRDNVKNLIVEQFIYFENKLIVYLNSQEFIQVEFEGLKKKCSALNNDFDFIDFKRSSKCHKGSYYSYFRKNPKSLCLLDMEAPSLMRLHACNCTILDYECVSGFSFDKSWNCVPQVDEAGSFVDSKMLEYTSEYTSIICENEKSYFKPSGYTLKLGNQCKDGLQIKDLMELECINDKNNLNDEKENSQNDNYVGDDFNDEVANGKHDESKTGRRNYVENVIFVDENEKVKPENPATQLTKGSNYEMLDYYNFTIPGKILRSNFLKLSAHNSVTNEDDDDDDEHFISKSSNNLNNQKDEIIMMLTDKDEFYFSTDFGKSFKVFKKISGYHIQEEKISLVNVDDQIIYSLDHGKTWRKFRIPPTGKREVVEISYHVTFSHWIILTVRDIDPLVAISYISVNFGADWFILKRNVVMLPTYNKNNQVQSCFFSSNYLTSNELSKSILCPLLFRDIKKDYEINKNLVWSDDFFITNNNYLQDYDQFYLLRLSNLRSEILTVDLEGKDKIIKLINHNNNNYKKKAIFPSDFNFGEDEYITLMDNHFSSAIQNSSTKIILADKQNNIGKLFKSNSENNKFVLIKNNIQFINGHGFSFEKVHHLDGILIINHVSNANVVSEISFDDGVNWQPLKVESNTVCDNCSLHLEYLNKVSISSIYGTGLLLGVGNIGKHFNEQSFSKSLFVSVNGGVSWNESLTGGVNYKFVILDHGSVIIVMKDEKLFYSTNYGASFTFIPLEIESDKNTVLLDTITLDSSKKFLISSEYDEGNFTQILLIDFSKTLNRKCNFNPYIGSTDFELWKPWNPNYEQKDCLFGKQRQFYRKINDSLCSIDNAIPEEEHGKVLEFCDCELNVDFECDTNFVLSDDRKQCSFISETLYKSHFETFSRTCEEFYGALYFGMPSGFRKNSISTGCILTDSIKPYIQAEKFECPGKAKQISEAKKGAVNAGIMFLFIVCILAGFLFITLIISENFYMYDNVVRFYVLLARNSTGYICYYLLMLIIKPFIILYFMVVELIEESNSRMRHRRYRRIN